MADEKPKEDRRAVVDGKLRRTSVSAMQRADSCARAWFYRYVQRLPDKPPTAGAKLGEESHARIAHYLRTGENVLAPLERLGVDRSLVPSPSPSLLVEYPITLDLEGVQLGGFVDLITPHETQPLITDWKFKSDILKWGATSKDLVNPDHDAGIQMLGYAAWALGQFPKAERIHLRHVSFQTRGRADVQETKAWIPRHDVEQRWGVITKRILPVMHHAAKQEKAFDVPQAKDENTCDKYGGCAYREVCWDRMARIVAGFKKHAGQPEATNMGLMSSLINDEKTETKTEAKTEVMTAKECAQGARYVVKGQEAVFLCPVGKASGATKYSFAPEDGPPILVDGTEPVRPVEEIEDELAAVLPPDAPKSDPKLAAKVDPPPEPKPQAPSVPQTEAQMTKALEASIEQAPPKRGPGRPRKMKIEDAPAETPPPAAVPAPKPEVITFAAPAPKKEEPKSDGFVLYFGCSPVGVPTSTLHEYVEWLDRTFCKAAQLTIADLRVVNVQDYGFGKWTGYLSKLALEQLPPPGHYIVTRGDERIETVADALIGKAKLVVFGGGR